MAFFITMSQYINPIFWRFTIHAAKLFGCPKIVYTVQVPVFTMNFTGQNVVNITSSHHIVTRERVKVATVLKSSIQVDPPG